MSSRYLSPTYSSSTMQVDGYPSPRAFSEKSNYPSRLPFLPPPPPSYPSNDSSRYHTSTYSSSPREVAGYPSPRTVSQQNNYSSSRPIPPPPPPPPSSFSENEFYFVTPPPPPPSSFAKNEFYSLTPPPLPPPSSFERSSNYSSLQPPPPPPPPWFFEKRNYDSSPPTPPSQLLFEKKDDSQPPSPPSHSSNDSSRGTSDSSSEIAIASLGFGVVGTVANLVSLGYAARQDGTTKASLQLATAVAIRDLIAVHGVEGIRAISSSGIRTTVQDAQLVAEFLTTGGGVLARTTRTGASSLVSVVASSVTSLRSKLPSLSLYGRGMPSPTPNPSPLAPAEGPTTLGAPNEEEQGMYAHLEEEPNVPWTSGGGLRNFERGEVPESIFTIGTDPGDFEVNNDELGESTTFLRDDNEINNDELEESTIVRMDDTETNNDELEENTLVWTDNTEIYTNELEESTLVWSNERANVLKEKGLAITSCP